MFGFSWDILIIIQMHRVAMANRLKVLTERLVRKDEFTVTLDWTTIELYVMHLHTHSKRTVHHRRIEMRLFGFCIFCFEKGSEPDRTADVIVTILLDDQKNININ